MKPFKKNDYPTLGIEEELHAEQHLNFASTMIEQGSESELQRALCKNLNGDLVALEKELATRTLDFSV